MNRNYWMRQQSKYENMAYVALWGLLFAAPVLSLFIRTAQDSTLTFDWHEVLMVWRQLAIFLLLFLIHNFLLAPLLVYRQKRMLYFSLTTAMLACFLFFQCSSRPDGMQHQAMHDMAQHQPMHDGPRPHSEDGFDHDGDGFDHEPPPFEHDGHDARFDEEPNGRKDFMDRRRHKGPPGFIGRHDIISVIILFLMLGMNVGIKLYFKTRLDQKKMDALQKENLEQQLEYLKYQINPHFFMNTLNNIHALVDIDPEKAKDTILELSKMMRFILYEGDKNGVPLTREFEFIRHYVTLMRLRYTDKVKISVDLPAEAPDKLIPPLMLITFIENAFKHGISYQRESFISVKVGIEHERLRFECRNSKADKPNQEKGGVGLANVKQRLNLLYGNNFTLNIQDEPDIYNVELNIPLT
ncbi:MAG: histidine kinase [Prevotella sp.]|nr:histidine kinase [Prevotella sp.]